MTEPTPSQSNVEDAILTAIQSCAQSAGTLSVPASALAQAQAVHELTQAYKILRNT